ncbi:hypothetical protein ACFXB3_02250 [Streptomyces sp. NPDC059447]|uniref:hypothetical protein n=1 Tax=Streptomyces sp. NPDC059447 TaxID=3346834 RepID=UPI00368BBC40
MSITVFVLSGRGDDLTGIEDVREYVMMRHQDLRPKTPRPCLHPDFRSVPRRRLGIAQTVHRARRGHHILGQPHQRAQKTCLFDLRRPALRYSRARTQKRHRDAHGGDVHKEGLVIGPQIMPNSPASGHTALQSQQVAVTGVREHHHRPAQSWHRQHAPGSLQQVLDPASEQRSRDCPRGRRGEEEVQELWRIRKGGRGQRR